MTHPVHALRCVSHPACALRWMTHPACTMVCDSSCMRRVVHMSIGAQPHVLKPHVRPGACRCCCQHAAHAVRSRSRSAQYWQLAAPPHVHALAPFETAACSCNQKLLQAACTLPACARALAIRRRSRKRPCVSRTFATPSCPDSLCLSNMMWHDLTSLDLDSTMHCARQAPPNTTPCVNSPRPLPKVGFSRSPGSYSLGVAVRPSRAPPAPHTDAPCCPHTKL